MIRCRVIKAFSETIKIKGQTKSLNLIHITYKEKQISFINHRINQRNVLKLVIFRRHKMCAIQHMYIKRQMYEFCISLYQRKLIYLVFHIE